MDHYFSEKPSVISEPLFIEVNILNTKFKFKTDKGVFSRGKLDEATRYLLENIVIKEGSSVLDIGCGFGPMGIILTNIYNTITTMVDINERAIELALYNVDLNKVNIDVFKSDVYSRITSKYNYIISNPPIHAGKKIIYSIFKNAKKHLNKNGELWIVINKKHGSKSTITFLETIYKDVQTIYKKKGFSVIKAI